MLTIIEIRSILEQPSSDGTISKFQQFLFQDPEEAGRFNITTWDAQRISRYQTLKGQTCLIGLQKRKTSSGSDYYLVTKDPVPLSEFIKINSKSHATS